MIPPQSGIHFELAKLAHEDGAKVIIADIRRTKDVDSLLSQTFIFQECDVAKWADLRNLITISQTTFGDVPDVYVAGAGVFEPVSVWKCLVV